MSQQEKSAYFQALKGLGVEFTKHYREYSEADLKEAYDKFVEAGQAQPLIPLPGGLTEPKPRDTGIKMPPLARKDPNELAGQRQNTLAEDEPLRTDPDTGIIWYQEEVMKKAFAAPRGRRVLKYNDPGVKEESAQNGEFLETFEVAGDRSIPSEVKITLPSYQVGIYKDPRFPFKINCYNGQEGFDLFEVEEFYGGKERVPEDVKRCYVENMLCYDIRTVVRDIETEYRRLQLAGKA